MKDLICSHCGHRLSTRYNLRKHIEATHLKLKPFTCSCCPKAFSYKHSFVNHMKAHMKEDSAVKVINNALRSIAKVIDFEIAKKPITVMTTNETGEKVTLPRIEIR